ncbi:hypothetical protein TrST_g4820 [Triparma strigata]|uniref:Exocyst complex component Sec8 n=1 Tax=Triparma strigata TaxID=1606541 RepID=A0A9W7EI18_9STRA|nr:hypothetical protein TrST_g4820 [Triparma strigata]
MESLSSIESQLNTISSEFFEPDPRKFKTLHHVINVLAASEDQDDLQSNDAYVKLQRQHKIVQDGIEVVVSDHYRELNAGVVGLGKVSRQFNDALLQVQRLRRQVKAVQKSLVNDLNREGGGSQNSNPSSQQNSLRDLYAKKKECNAVLLILEKLAMLREAPRRYDTLIQSHRLHAAISHLSSSLTMLFSEDVASVQALSKVGEDLMMRKGGAEDLCTDALCDLIFLRTGSLTRNQEKARLRPRAKTRGSKHRRGNSYHRHRTPSSNVSDSDSDSASNASSSDESSSAASFMGGSSASSPTRMNNSAPPLPHDKLLTQYTGRLLPEKFLSSTISDADEMEVIGSNTKLEYSSTILPTKIIVKSMGMIGRVDDIIRNVMSRAANEVASVERQTRLRTLTTVEDSQRPDAPKDLGLHFVRSHLFKVMNNYMDVTRRMGYCLQCINHEKQGISDKDQAKIKRNILTIVESMQSEIKDFLVCVLGEEVDDDKNESMERRSLLHRQTLSSATEKKSIFSLSINTDPTKNRNDSSKSSPVRSRRTRRRSSVGASTSATLVTSMSASQFVSTVLLRSSAPSVRHALPLRKYVARWCDGLALAVKEIFPEAAEDVDQGAKTYLDSVIEERLLPLLQSDTVDSVVTSLESPVAFRSPVIGTSLSTTNLLPAVTHACSTLLDKTEPLFEALHRLPVEGEIFTAVLAVLEHVILTFASRAKQRSGELMSQLTSYEMLGKDIDDSSKNFFSVSLERQSTFTQLMGVYFEDYGGSGPNTNPDSAGVGVGVGALRPPTLGRSVTTEQEMMDEVFEEESEQLKNLFNFDETDYGAKITSTSDIQHLADIVALAHSLLILSGKLEDRLKATETAGKILAKTRNLHISVNGLRTLGKKLCKVLRVEIQANVIKSMSTVSQLDDLFAESAAHAAGNLRIEPVSDLCEYIVRASECIITVGGAGMEHWAFGGVELLFSKLFLRSFKYMVGHRVTLQGIELLQISLKEAENACLGIGVIKEKFTAESFSGAKVMLKAFHDNTTADELEEFIKNDKTNGVTSVEKGWLLANKRLTML